jgi:two-component system, OmpR family, alkaline phosphatase synthesis response regulator PhoP
MTNHTILLVDDEADVLEFLSYTIQKEGYRVFTASNGLEAVKKTIELSPSLVLMDLMMPEMDGIEACLAIRNNASISQPIIALLTSRSEDYSQIAGFDAGADDYISKPIRPRLLVSKLSSLLRRPANEEIQSTKTNPGIVINRESFLVHLNNEDLSLPKKEFELLELLVSRPGKVFTRDQIMSIVWGNDAIVGERTIDVHIRKLREKLGNDYIRTVKGVGYTYNTI